MYRVVVSVCEPGNVCSDKKKDWEAMKFIASVKESMGEQIDWLVAQQSGLLRKTSISNSIIIYNCLKRSIMNGVKSLDIMITMTFYQKMPNKWNAVLVLQNILYLSLSVMNANNNNNKNSLEDILVLFYFLIYHFQDNNAYLPSTITSFVFAQLYAL